MANSKVPLKKLVDDKKLTSGIKRIKAIKKSKRATRYGRHRNDESGKINFLYDLCIVHHAVGRIGNPEEKVFQSKSPKKQKLGKANFEKVH